MPITAAQLAIAGKSQLDYYIDKNPIDQIGTDRPLLKWLISKKKTFPGGKQFVVEKLRTNYGSNFQWYFGNKTVTYNTRSTLEDANFTWGGFHDGFEISEDELFGNGIELVDDNKPTKATEAEKVQLVDLFAEKMEALQLGLEQSLDLSLHRAMNGTDGIIGLDALIATNPNAGVIGGIDRASATYWRNNAAIGVAKGSMVATMEKMWRACMRNGGQPDFIMMGSDALDAYAAEIGDKKQIVVNAGDTYSVEGGNSGYTFKGVKIVYDPVFEDLDATDAPAVPWVKRAYFLNSKHLRLRTGGKHWMAARTPKRDSNNYVHRFAVTGKTSLTMSRANAHGVMSIA